nr:uncharacterized protein LOC112020278 [Quercus suber]POF15550.1 hypothetical protein CFP56_48744 [Quercus suber]
MGWFWDSKKEGSDPYKQLDPSLREFLDDSTPNKSKSPPLASHAQPPPSPDAASNTYRAQLGWTTSPEPTTQDLHSSAPPASATNANEVPPESLFPDGRYAHLWKTYRHQSEVDAAGKSDQERLSDVVDTYKDRQAAIGRAAVENCILEQMAERECWTSGSWMDRATMCRKEARSFTRCYDMQQRFLKALGYLSQMRSGEEEERIQMHADKLYHEMLAREKAVQEADVAGLPAPKQEPLLNPSSLMQALGEDSAYARARQKAADLGVKFQLSEMPKEAQEKIQGKLRGKSEFGKEVEMQLMAAEARAKLDYAQQLNDYWEEERQHRAERRESGKETFGDQIKRWSGWQQ